MRSFLLEYQKRDNNEEENSEIDIHVNLWGINADKTEDEPEIVIDFGFMVTNIENIKRIVLYCPFNIQNVDDLGGQISKNTELIEAIFNEDCTVVTNYHPNRIKIAKKSKSSNKGSGANKESSENNYEKGEFILYKLDNRLINFNNESEYGKIELNVENILSENEKKWEDVSVIKKYYFRIRIFPKSVSFILKRENSTVNILQDSSLRTTEIIDFRINDFRSITENMKEEFFRLNRFKIKNIHYFIMRSSTDEFVSGYSEYKSRILEKEIWKDYIELNKGDVIAYHFKKIGGCDVIDSFKNLSRFKYPLNIMKRIGCYIILIMGISILSSFLSSWIYDYFFRK